MRPSDKSLSIRYMTPWDTSILPVMELLVNGCEARNKDEIALLAELSMDIRMAQYQDKDKEVKSITFAENKAIVMKEIASLERVQISKVNPEFGWFLQQIRESNGN